MFGFPTETIEEAQQTISFIEKNADSVVIIRANPWLLTPESEVFKNLEAYGINFTMRGYQFMNPRSYTIQEGINFDEAMDLMNDLQHHPVLGEKVMKYDLFNGYPEDYQIIIKMCERTRDH